MYYPSISLRYKVPGEPSRSIFCFPFFDQQINDSSNSDERIVFRMVENGGGHVQVVWVRAHSGTSFQAYRCLIAPEFPTVYEVLLPPGLIHLGVRVANSKPLGI